MTLDKTFGSYDDICDSVRIDTQAHATMVLVLNGNRGSGFSFQGDTRLLGHLPELLERMAHEMRVQLERSGKINGHGK